MQTCPFCRQADLADDARRCQHCGSWLNAEDARDDLESFRRELRADLNADLQAHRSFIERMLGRLQTFGGIIIAAALAATVFFGYRTDQSITETTEKIGKDAEAQVRTAVETRMASDATQQLIEATLTRSIETAVQHEVGNRIEAMKATIQDRLDAAGKEVAGVQANIDELRSNTEKASTELQAINTRFSATRAQTVESSRSVLPIEALEVGGKGGIDQLRSLLDRHVNALRLQLEAGYVGAFVWRYMQALGATPDFRYVILFAPNGHEVIGLWQAEQLAAALNPPDQAELVEAVSDHIEHLPDQGRIPGWERFVTWLRQGKVDRLAALAHFQPSPEPVRVSWQSLQALDHMESKHADRLPVVDGSGTLVGVIERSRLTTRVLLELARNR